MTVSASAAKITNPPSASFNPVKWLFRLEAGYRQATQLKQTEDCYLKDMGLTRSQANTAFYQKWNDRG